LYEIQTALVAFSGGVDSSFLAFAAARVLENRMIAATIVSPVDPAAAIEAAVQFARQYNIPHIQIAHNPLADASFKANPPDRCYLCKTQMLNVLWRYARDHDISAVLEGQNADDGLDYRPGSRAVSESGTLSPLALSKLNKVDIRTLSRAMGLSCWDQPSSPCLATRIPYGEDITVERLQQIAEAESFLRQAGFPIVRVRHHGNLARIEIPPAQLTQLLSCRDAVAIHFKQIGFRHITLDLQGYRLGSFNEGLLS
ncbi:MAG TPA: ATP-dependent sacrificial sulfur transferase LarE, partial [Anaerolineaceae bacterium]|nr:ATP-dependent sacrificial sulfur transferase LarE [Anaerolineaceae bacterium]